MSGKVKFFAALSGISVVVISILIWPGNLGSHRDKLPNELMAEVQTQWQLLAIGTDQTLQTNDFGLWWVIDEGFSVINDNEQAIEFRRFECKSESMPESDELAKKLAKTVDEIMVTNGYTLNKNNSSASFVDYRFYDYIRAYEKGNIKAVYVQNPDCWANGDEQMHLSSYFSFTTKLDKNKAEQLPILQDLKIEPDAVIHLSDRVDDFAIISVNFRRTGHFIIAKNVNGHWKELFSGQEAPPCSLTKKWQIPESLSGCYEY